MAGRKDLFAALKSTVDGGGANVYGAGEAKGRTDVLGRHGALLMGCRRKKGVGVSRTVRRKGKRARK